MSLPAQPQLPSAAPARDAELALPVQVDWMLTTDLFVDIWMLADIVMNFHTGFIVEQARLQQCGACAHSEGRKSPCTGSHPHQDGHTAGAAGPCARVARRGLQPPAVPGAGRRLSGCALQVLVMEKQAVKRHYLRHWFALDLAAAFPLDLLFAGKRLDIWRLPRLLKVIRVLKYKSLHHAGVGPPKLCPLTRAAPIISCVPCCPAASCRAWMLCRQACKAL